MKKIEDVVNDEMMEEEFLTDEELDSLENKDVSDYDETLNAEDDYLENSFGLYLKEISRTPLLSASEEIELAKRVERGDVAARNRMIESNLRLVVSIAKRYVGRGLPLQDLVQEGTLGLMKSVDKYDWRLFYRFSTYSSYWIRQSIGRAISDLSRTIRVPAHTGDALTKLNYKKSELAVRLGHEPSISELAEEMELTDEEVTEYLTIPMVGISLDTPVGENEDTFYGDIVPDKETPSLEKQMISIDEINDIRRLLTVLSERERQVLILRFGLGGENKHTLDEVGRKLGVSKERVRQIESVSIRKMRNAAIQSMAS